MPTTAPCLDLHDFMCLVKKAEARGMNIMIHMDGRIVGYVEIISEQRLKLSFDEAVEYLSA